jgi:hypothetical protein
VSDFGVETFQTPSAFLQEGNASDLHTSLGEQVGAEASQAFMGGVRSLGRGLQYLSIEHPEAATAAADATMAEAGLPPLPEEKPHEVPMAEARERVKAEGMEGHLKLPAQDTIRKPALDLMIQAAHERAEYEAAVGRGPHGFVPSALGTVTEIGLGMIDPVNIAAFSIPVIGELRYGKMLAEAGESVIRRSAIAAGVGAAQGTVGGAALAPLDWWLHTKDGQDYTFSDALRSVILSAGMGAAFHGGGRLVGDAWASFGGKPLPGSVEDLRLRAIEGDSHAAQLLERLTKGEAARDQIVTAPATDLTQVPGVSHPAEVIADLPVRAQEDMTKAAIADVIEGRPVRAAEMLAEAAKEDPRLAPAGLTGRPHVDAVLSEPVVRDAVLSGTINRENDVPYGAGPNNKNDGVTNIDRHVPERDVINDRAYDPALPAAIHEHVEKFVMERLIARFKERHGRAPNDHEMDAMYKIAHFQFAEVAERAWVEAKLGPDAWREYQAHWAEWLKSIEHENPKNPPADLYQKPYPHDDVHLAPQTHDDEFSGRAVHEPAEKPAETSTAADAVPPSPQVAAPSAGALRPRANWQRLRDLKRDPDPDLADASQAAEETPEIESTQPGKAMSAAEQAAADADKLLADILPKLTEEERQRFDEALAAVAYDRNLSEIVVRDGAACLAGAAVAEAL